ncbi:hypothetical protein CRE_06106 [Caenorhabditis remanei]|uniref:F-box domain-containing protein n=1 Tax=Caenorhabditis remanei TaxID=31234 RepID=E3NEC9_CAERE|nr:hypothetical protein CRE_06106 [Caenorhabditis remanei]
MERSFPLFRLPENAIAQVLQNMNSNKLFLISLASSKSKNLVTSLGIRACDVEIRISREISFSVRIGVFLLNLILKANLNDQNAALPADITLPVDAFLSLERKRIQPSIPFNFGDWMNHIRTVFCYTNPQSLGFYQDCERFEVQSLKNTIGNVDVLYVASEVTNVYSKEVLKVFNASNKLFLERNPFDEACEIQQFFVQNYKRIGFRDAYSLDDMLLVNSEKAKFTHPTSPNQFNQFLKHWIRGSNPRLQNMFSLIDNTNSVSREVLLKGIQYVDVAKEVRQEIYQKHSINSVHMVQIRRLFFYRSFFMPLCRICFPCIFLFYYFSFPTNKLFSSFSLLICLFLISQMHNSFIRVRNEA